MLLGILALEQPAPDCHGLCLKGSTPVASTDTLGLRFGTCWGGDVLPGTGEGGACCPLAFFHFLESSAARGQEVLFYREGDCEAGTEADL